jgi:hypothetical protein
MADKVTVSEPALIQRINRKLRRQPNPERLVRARSKAGRQELGSYYTLEISLHVRPRTASSEGIGRVHIDNLEQYARELGVLREWEAVLTAPTN